MNTCDYIIETLYLNGIDTYFVITGGAIVPFINAISRNPKVKYYCFQHEQSAAMAAEGYYRASGKTAGVVVTSGPGVQNILNGVCGCWYDSVPAFFISGQVNTAEDLSNFSCTPRQTGFQEMPVADMFSGVTKRSVHVPSVEALESILRELLELVKTPRYGPVLMDLPVNIQMSTTQSIPSQIHEEIQKQKHTYDISSYIKESKRPLVMFGHGVKLCGAERQALAFVEKYEIQNADLLISIGSRLDSRQIGGNTQTFSKYSKKIMVDVDREEIMKMSERGIHIDYEIQESPKTFLEHAIIDTPPVTRSWIETLQGWKTKYGKEPSRDGDSAVYDYLSTFFDTLPDECIVIPDQGGNLVWTMQSAKLKKGQKLFTNFGNSSMGFALPAAIGAAIGSGKKVYCIDGDGGFQMNIQELLTVKKYDLPIEIIILNNSGYGIIKQFQDSYFGSKYVATSKSDVFGDEVQFTQIAEAYGVHSLKHVPIPETQKIYPKLEFGNSLENMTPYIDFESDMIVDVPPKRKLGWV